MQTLIAETVLALVFRTCCLPSNMRIKTAVVLHGRMCWPMACCCTEDVPFYTVFHTRKNVLKGKLHACAEATEPDLTGVAGNRCGATAGGAVGPMMLGSCAVSAFSLLAAWLMPVFGALPGCALSWVLSITLVSIPVALWLRRGQASLAAS